MEKERRIFYRYRHGSGAFTDYLRATVVFIDFIRRSLICSYFSPNKADLLQKKS